MNPEIKAKWLQALRSGEYKKCTGLLRRDDSYCCLGVLCDLRDPSNWERVAGVYNYLDCMSLLPTQVRLWAGLTNDLSVGDQTLIACNDGTESINAKSFHEIADLIEKHL